MKKILFIFIISILCLFLNACEFTNRKNASEFERYINELPQRMISSDNLNLEFTFAHPENYGFKKTLLNLPYSDEQDYQQNIENTEILLNELNQFDYTTFDSELRLTYDVLKDYLERSLLTMHYYDLDNSYLGSYLSFQAQLPFLLSEYTFDSEADLQSYFHILESSKEVFHKYAALENDRQSKGAGLSKTVLEKTIQQCDRFSNADPLFLVDRINEKIDDVPFLNDAEKKEAKIKNEDLLVNHLQQAYANTKNELSSIQVNEEDLGLAYKPNGKEYYEALLRQSTGIDMNVEEVKEYLHQKYSEVLSKYREFINNHPEFSSNELLDMQYTAFTSVEETLDYLRKKSMEDFPIIQKINYEITKVDESMKKHFSPAAYLQSKLDSSFDDPESIIINGDYNDSLFSTIMHEGYPGHMYQTVYYKTLQKPAIRYILEYNGYSEGWATYVEKYSSHYAQTEDKALLELYNLNHDLLKIWLCRFDIGIHYEGWDRTKFKQEINVIFQNHNLEETAIDEQYDLFLETPTNTLKYNLTYFKFQDLYKKAEDALHRAFDPIQFHEVILKTGPTPFHILEKQVDNYIMNKQQQS